MFNRHLAFARPLLVLVLCGFILSSCGSLNINGGATGSSKQEVPGWFWDPSHDGRMGGVGVAGYNIKGKNAQRRLAISRAMDEIAVQKGVRVSSVLKTHSSASSTGSSATAMETYSFQTTDGKVVVAKIMDIWEDTTRDELYIWMVEVD